MRPDGRIEVLNRRWHQFQRLGSCASCETDILPEERAVFLNGEDYHEGCAVNSRGS